MANSQDVRLDETTDAGEFLLQNLYRIRNHDHYVLARDLVCEPKPTPADLAAVLDVKELTETLMGLGEYGMSFESKTEQPYMEQETRDLAERGVSSAEDFVRAAIAIRREAAA